jgi:hypothetical protein
MEKGVKFWGSLAGAMISTLVLGTYLAGPVAAAEVRPLENRVTRLEAQRVEDVRRLEDIKANVEELLRRVPPRP